MRAAGRRVRQLGLALLGVALGGLGIGWHGQPAEDVIAAAIRARDPAYARAAITLADVDRNWPHEILDGATSRFLVRARIAPPDGEAVERCFGVEAGLAGTALALGPYADWRCDYPF
ncbi:MAG: hypothetical protein IT293_09035 [Deltaproteobacteria bacterium]|nr:hypothetical protein [Deltaproteobacteria bacterium]